jgi:hypothetical protein
VGRRVDLKEAAELLDTTSEAIRKRAKRGTIPFEVGNDGKLYVWVDGQVDEEHDRVDDAAGRVDERVDGQYRDLLLEHMSGEIDHLREELREEREANRENRRIIAGLVQRVPEIEASPEPRETPQTATDGTSGSGGRDEDTGPEQRSWWWRWLLGTE